MTTSYDDKVYLTNGSGNAYNVSNSYTVNTLYSNFMLTSSEATIGDGDGGDGGYYSQPTTYTPIEFYYIDNDNATRSCVLTGDICDVETMIWSGGINGKTIYAYGGGLEPGLYCLNQLNFDVTNLFGNDYSATLHTKYDVLTAMGAKSLWVKFNGMTYYWT